MSRPLNSYNDIKYEFICDPTNVMQSMTLLIKEAHEGVVWLLGFYGFFLENHNFVNMFC